MKYNAMEIDVYQHSRSLFKSYAAGASTKPMLIRLAKILDQLEPQGDDNLHTIWAKANRPTFRQFYELHYEYDTPYKEATAEIIQSAREFYTDSYPTPKVWYQLSVKHFSRNPNDEFYALFIDNSYVFSINDTNSEQEYDDTDLLQWAIEEAEWFVEEVKNGTYEKNILNKIPYCYREGKIKRSDLWEAYPESKKHFYENYKMEDIEKFLSVFNSGKTVNTLLQKMTARYLYDACATIYTALGLHRENATYQFEESEAEHKRYGKSRQTPKEMYYAIADGRDNGLKNVPMDDPIAFAEWFHKKGPYYEFNGSHPWEIIPSMSTTNSMHLYPRNNETEGWRFLLSGESEVRAPETVVAANALYDSGYPVEVYNFDIIANRFAGNDYISVVPKSESTYFFESIHLPEGKLGKAVAMKTIWKLNQYSMKNSK